MDYQPNSLASAYVKLQWFADYRALQDTMLRKPIYCNLRRLIEDTHA